MRALRFGATSSLLLGLAACTVGPDYTPPEAPSIAAWDELSVQRGAPDEAVSQRSNPDPEWWNGFDDPLLTSLMSLAVAGNLDLGEAVLRVVESHQGEIVARAAGLPSLSGAASYSREQLGARGLLESSGAYGQLNTLANQNPGLGTALTGITKPGDLFEYSLSASWELDLFGRVRRSVEQATAQTQAQVEQTNDALVMLEGQVADAYVQLRGAQALSASQRENIGTARQSLDLAQRRQSRGLASALDVEQARTQLADNESQLPGYEKQQQQAMNRLSVLTGQPPGALDAMLDPPAPMPHIPPVLAIGVPSTLARRRPDIRAAEAQLHAATANVGIAVASFYPDVSLTGSVGMRATDASYLTNWASHYYSAGPSLSLPIFEGGRLTANLHLARAEAAEAALVYRGTVLNALREVEDALVAYRTDQTARTALAETVRSAETTLYLARNRYTHGLSDFIQVLDSERTLIASRQQLVQEDMTLASDVVALYEALGGGWQRTVDQIPAPPIDAATPMSLDSLAGGPTP